MKTIFPSADYLVGSYPWLKKFPWLLPIAWTGRILKYCKETRQGKGTAPANSIRIGNERVELLKTYGVLK